DVPAGNYSVVVTDANGCEAEASTTVVNPAPVVARIINKSEYGGYGVSCNGSADGHLSCSAAGGQGPYQYTWSYGGFQTADITALGAGHYEVRVTDANGCNATADAFLKEPDSLVIQIDHIEPAPCGNSSGRIDA